MDGVYDYACSTIAVRSENTFEIHEACAFQDIIPNLLNMLLRTCAIRSLRRIPLDEPAYKIISASKNLGTFALEIDPTAFMTAKGSFKALDFITDFNFPYVLMFSCDFIKSCRTFSKSLYQQLAVHILLLIQMHGINNLRTDNSIL